MAATRAHPARAAAFGVLALASLLLMTGCGVAADGPVTATPTPVAQSATPTPTPTATGAPAGPAASAVPLTDASLGAHPAEAVVQPARVQVPSLEIDVTVAPEGVDANGALALSDDPAIASWYRYGPTPWSTAGTSVIAAHVDSFDYGIGQFARLLDAPVGTEIVITAVDGRVARFSVQQVSMVDKTGVDWNSVFDRSGPHLLALVTCGGEFNYETGHYLSNVIVTAVPIA